MITISDKAATKIQELLVNQNHSAIRVKVKSGGCSGLSYMIEYADEPRNGEEVISQKNATVYIDPKAVLYLIGTEMDYTEDKFKSGFVFNNPNAKSKCGCGESFSV